MGETLLSEALEIGRQLVRLCRSGRELEAIDALYAPNIVSLEGRGTEQIPARMQGREAVRLKHLWWTDHHELHSLETIGPFCGHRDDQFAVRFEFDLTHRDSGQRMQLSEIALYTVHEGRIVQEEFLYLTEAPT